MHERTVESVTEFSFFVKVWLTYNVVPISAVQQSDPVIYLCICMYIPFLMLSSIMVCPKRLDRVPYAIQQDRIAHPF